MKIIIDANIVFGGILNTKGKIGDLLINSKSKFELIAPNFLRAEIQKNYPKLMKLSGLTLQQIQESEFQICKNIIFISEEQIILSNWLIAEKLVADVDPNDIHYIAYSKQFKCKIWSGDKALRKGLAKKGFVNFVTTDERFELRES